MGATSTSPAITHARARRSASPSLPVRSDDTTDLEGAVPSSIIRRRDPHRPKAVVVLREGQDRTPWDGFWVQRIPKDATENEKVHAEAMAWRSTCRLLAGDSIEFALESVVGGRDSLVEEIRRRGGNMTRDQIAYSEKKLEAYGTIACTGQRDRWIDPDAGWKKKSGAKLWRICGTIRQVGDHVALTLKKRARRRSPTRKGYVGVNPRTRRLQACLEGAIENAHEGNRNAIGHWLACRSTDVGLTENQAKTWMELYRKGLPKNGHAYTLTEAMKTLRGVYRRQAHA
jgi:hypothetical protein